MEEISWFTDQVFISGINFYIHGQNTFLVSSDRPLKVLGSSVLGGDLRQTLEMLLMSWTGEETLVPGNQGFYCENKILFTRCCCSRSWQLKPVFLCCEGMVTQKRKQAWGRKPDNQQARACSDNLSVHWFFRLYTNAGLVERWLACAGEK